MHAINCMFSEDNLQLLFRYTRSVCFLVEYNSVSLAEYHEVVEVHFWVDYSVLVEVGVWAEDYLLFDDVGE